MRGPSVPERLLQTGPDSYIRQGHAACSSRPDISVCMVGKTSIDVIMTVRGLGVRRCVYTQQVRVGASTAVRHGRHNIDKRQMEACTRMTMQRYRYRCFGQSSVQRTMYGLSDVWVHTSQGDTPCTLLEVDRTDRLLCFLRTRRS